MKTLRASSGNFLILLDDEDFYRCKEIKWGFYGTHTQRVCSTGTKQVSIANFIMGTIGIMYDHKDLNPLNNQKSNLRITTNQLNQANRTKDLFYKPTTSIYKGVGWRKGVKKWRAYITFNGKHISLGYFSNEKGAAKAYDRKALQLFREFARLNFPEVEQTNA